MSPKDLHRVALIIYTRIDARYKKQININRMYTMIIQQKFKLNVRKFA